MKGYYVPSGYMGYDPRTKRYQLFATEEEYVEYAEFIEENSVVVVPNFSLDNSVAMR